MALSLSPSPPLQVAGGSFFRLKCNHEQLFHPEYKRSNRTKGLKILRCFPHCCPEHIDRSYCGSSLSLAVRLAGCPPPGTAPPDEVLSVFARFEMVSDVSLQTGECVEMEKIHQGVQTETNLNGQWVAGVLDRPSELVTNISTASTVPTPHSLTFHLNNKTCSRWCYDWESGANKSHRLMKHVLKAYVMERVAVDMNDNFTFIANPKSATQLYKVVHVVTSPKFTVISYRRAPVEDFQAVSQLRLAKTQIHQHLIHGYLPTDKPRVSLSAGVTHNVRALARENIHTSSGRLVYEEDRKTTVYPLGDKLLWEHANAPAVSVSKNLALLYAFLRWAPIRFYVPLIDELVDLVRNKLLSPLSETKLSDKSNCFLRVILDNAHAEDKLRADGASPVWREIEALLRVAAQAAVWLYSKETRHWIRTFFQQNAACVLDKSQLRACFLQFLGDLEEQLNTEVFAVTTMGRLDNVAEEVIAVVYSCEYFHKHRSEVRRILTGPSFSGWKMFVAQMRDTFIGTTTLPRGVEAFAMAYPPHNDTEEKWNGEWVLDTEATNWSVDGGNPYSRDVSFYSLVALISQIAHLEISIDIQESSLRIRSLRGVAGRFHCMHLVLDGKERIFRLFPNGVTSSGWEGLCGDYIGGVRVDEPDNLVVSLDLFKWAVEHSYHARVRIEYQQSGQLSMDGDILMTTGPLSFTVEEMQYIPLHVKRDTVENANATEAASWKEHSRFHLSYCKV